MTRKDFILDKKDLGGYLKDLSSSFQVFVPKEKDGVSYFEEYKGEEGMELGKRTTKPPKEIIFPQTERFFKFRKVAKEVELEIDVGDDRKRVIFGIRPCDAKGFLLLDNVFKEGIEDTFYFNKRNNTLLIGLACNEPSINCFCTSLGMSPHAKDGLDVLFTDIGDRYYVEVVSERGEEVVISDFLTVAREEDKTLRDKVHKAAEGKIRRKMDKGAISKLREESLFESAIWKEIARRCIGCGTCAYLCPTCHCFDIQDEVTVIRGRRVRVWDSCMFPEYTLEASGHNPRPTRRERIRNRVYHKYKWYMENYGEVACVGCGRCIEKCPVNIDIIEVFEVIGKTNV
ncbi:MAG: 4Fe-4S dicluster domain-containing protein [Candidatus Methanospirareceae archaeon]